MQLDKEMLNRLLELSDSEFKRKVSKAAEGAGVQNDKLDKVLSDVKNIKKTLGNMSEAELKQIVQSLGTEQVEQVLKNFRNSAT